MQLTVYLANLVFFLKPQDLEARLGAHHGGPSDPADAMHRKMTLRHALRGFCTVSACPLHLGHVNPSFPVHSLDHQESVGYTAGTSV